MGYGYVDRDWYLANLSSNAVGPHNFIFSILINGGLILIGIFIVMFLITYYNYRHHINSTTTTLMLGLITLLFMQLMEVYPIFFTIYLMILINYYPYISKLWEKPQPPLTSQEHQSPITNHQSPIQ